ncbi:MAG: hypothetical protein ACLTSU_07405 [Acutalibacteraceae bacterium]
MQFKSDGTLKIMQITDMQEIPAISPDTLALLDAAVEAEHPDLVIYTGDQIKGYGVTYKGKTKKRVGGRCGQDHYRPAGAGNPAPHSLCRYLWQPRSASGHQQCRPI